MSKITSFILVLLISGAGFGVYKYVELNKKFENTKSELSSTSENLNHSINSLSEQLSASQSENGDLHVRLETEQAKNDLNGKTIESFSSAIARLDKITKTDRELLQKYSNVYFLNENYVPDHLSKIDPKLVSKKDTELQIHSYIKPYLEKMLVEMTKSGATTSVQSAYRSFGTQASLKSTYKVVYGAGTANQFSADQGYSEHQLGSTVDLVSTQSSTLTTSFEKTKSYEWLSQNAYKYGFVLSYPKGNQFYQFEPWHWRFVGVELATKLHNENKNFYDLDQREINDYLVKIFD